MALGRRRRQQQQALFIPAGAMTRSPGHPFYARLNELLSEAEFDKEIEQLCEPFYAERRGRPSIPPGVYFRMLLVGYFEGIDSQRGIAWRCADSRSLHDFLGFGATDRSPDHSSLTRVRQRLSLEVHQEAFDIVIRIAKDKGLVKGKTLAIDSTTLEANAAMKAIVRRDTGKDWKEYVRGLAEAEGLEDPSDDDLRRFDRSRRGKKVSNKDWESPSDPDARITKMKDGRTRLGYKAQHAIDADTEIIVGATIHHADAPDGEIVKDAIIEVGGVTESTGITSFKNVVADKGYHKAETLAWLQERELTTYISEPRSPHKRRWTDKPADWEHAYRNNRRRSASPTSCKLHRLRSERVERSFAHTCRTGGARRTWLRGIVDISKRYMIQAAGRNLGTIMRAVFGVGTPRALQAGAGAAFALLSGVLAAICALLCDFQSAILRTLKSKTESPMHDTNSQRDFPPSSISDWRRLSPLKPLSSTAC